MAAAVTSRPDRRCASDELAAGNSPQTNGGKNMTKRALLIASVLWLGGGMVPRQAVADVEGPVYWSSAAHTCTPGTNSLQFDRYSTWYNYISWNGSNLDAIALWCPVQPNTGESEPNRLYATVLDNTGTATDTYVKATLYKIHRTTGAVTTLDDVSSDDDSTTTVKHIYTQLSEGLDFDTYDYYVRVDMDRDGTGDDARIYGVALEYAVP
jgi:hypothetical protein